MSLFQPRRDEEWEDMEQQVCLALEEWKEARNFFENATGQAMVEYAAFRLETTKLRYQYMLGQAKAMRRSKAPKLSARQVKPADATQ